MRLWGPSRSSLPAEADRAQGRSIVQQASFGPTGEQLRIPNYESAGMEGTLASGQAMQKVLHRPHNETGPSSLAGWSGPVSPQASCRAEHLLRHHLECQVQESDDEAPEAPVRLFVVNHRCHLACGPCDFWPAGRVLRAMATEDTRSDGSITNTRWKSKASRTVLPTIPVDNPPQLRPLMAQMIAKSHDSPPLRVV